MSGTILPPSEDQSLTLLKGIAEALNETNDVMEAMDAILPRLRDVLGLSTAWAFRYDPSRSCFVEVGASGLPESLAKCDALPLKTGWCECQDQFYKGQLDKAVNIVRCSRLRDAEGDTAGLLFHASIPLKSKGRLLGILNVAAPGRFSCSDPVLDLLSAVGSQVAVAFDRAGRIANETRRTRQLRTISEIAADLTTMLHMETILQTAVDRMIDVLGYTACGIVSERCTSDGECAKTIVVSSYPENEEHLNEYRYEVDMEEKLLPDHERILLENARSVCNVEIPHTEYQIRIESCIANAFSEIDRDLLAALAGHIAAALENAKLHQQSLEDAKWMERRKLAADLHDSVSQQLFSATLLAKTSGMLLQELKGQNQIEQEDRQEKSIEQIIEITERIQHLIKTSQEEMRSLIQTLRPSHERGLTAMIRERLTPLQLQNQTKIHFSVEVDQDIEVSFVTREALLHVVDEAIQNVLKHANARNVYIVVAMRDDVLRVSIRDDGIGFSEQQIQSGLGTTTMYERMQRVGGKLYIKSTVGKGTTVVAEVIAGR